jgi:hypothetical protein
MARTVATLMSNRTQRRNDNHARAAEGSFALSHSEEQTRTLLQYARGEQRFTLWVQQHYGDRVMAHTVTSAPSKQNMCSASMLDPLPVHSLAQARAEPEPNMHASTRRYYPTV